MPVVAGGKSKLPDYKEISRCHVQRFSIEKPCITMMDVDKGVFTNGSRLPMCLYKVLVV